MTNTIEKLQNPYMVTFFMTMIFTVSFLSGSPWHFVISGIFLLFFILYCTINYCRSGISFARFLLHKYPKTSGLLLAFALSSSISLLSVLLQDVAIEQKIGQSLKHTYYLLMFAFCFCLAWFAAINRLSHQKIYLAFAFGVWGLLLSLWVLYYFFDAPNYAKWGGEPPVGGNIRLIAMSISIAITTILVQILFGKNSLSSNIFLYFSLFAFTAFLTWSGSRGSSLCTIFLIVVLLATQWQFGQFKLKQFSLLLVLFITAIIYGYYLPVVGGGGLAHFAAKFQADPGDTMLGVEHIVKVGNGRIQAWLNVLDVLRDAPLFGLGAFGYFFYEKAPYHTDHVHNIFLQFFVEWGIVGGFLLLALIAVALIQLVRGFRTAVEQHNISFVMTAALILLLTLNGLTDGTYSALLPIFLVVTAYSFLLVKPLQCLIQQSQP